MEDFFSEKYDSLILDIDGTIWNTTGIVSVAWNKAIDQSGFVAKKVNADILQKEFGKTMDVIARDLWPELSREERGILLSHCVSEEQIALRNNTLDLTYPGLVETVKKVARVMPCFVVSNCQSGYIELMLEKTGLADSIKDFECYGRTGKGKAENLLLLKARASLVSPVYVGDTQGDADACRQAGIPFVFAEYGFGSVKAEDCAGKIKTFSDIISVFRR